jgi:hypothetical protein
MPVNGLLLTLSADPILAEDARRCIGVRSEVELAPARDRWQPLAVETTDVKAAHDFHEWLEALPGVDQVEVIYVGFDEHSPIESAP